MMEEKFYVPSGDLKAQMEKRLKDVVKNNHSCSFCGKEQHEVRHLIAGPPDVCICDECVTECVEILREEDPKFCTVKDRELVI